MTRQEFKRNCLDFAWNLWTGFWFIVLASAIVLGALPHFGGSH